MAGWRDAVGKAAFGRAGRPYRRAMGAAAAAAAGSAAGIYFRILQARRLEGALPPGRRMPGDAVLSGRVHQYTHSILISAPAGDIWPFLNRLGHSRAGWYIFDRLTAPDPRGPDRFAPLRAVDTGDELGDLLSAGTGHRLRIKEVQPNEWMLWADGDGRSTWLWLLQPARGNQTRLLVRGRFRYGLHPGRLAAMPLDAVDRATMRRCLIGIRDRAVLRSATRFDGR